MAPVVCEELEKTFCVSSNSIRVYSMKTGLQISTLRGEAKDVHKSKIISLSLMRFDQQPQASNFTGSLRLLSVCGKGVLAEWNPQTHEILARYQLDLGQEGKAKLVALNKNNIVVYQSASGCFKVFDTVTRQLVG